MGGGDGWKESLKFERRNMQFKDVIGQEEVKAKLRAAVQEGRIPHAQLFAGAPGSGNMALALAYAQYINCPNRTAEDSCGVCPTCLQYSKLQHPDLHFAFPLVTAKTVCDSYFDRFRQLCLDKPYFDLSDWYEVLEVKNQQGRIYDEESGEIVRKLSLKSFGSGYKVMIIWQADKMGAECSNKLLKLLEEPPAGTVFLLVSEQPDMLLATIQSRVQRVQVPRLTDEEVAAALEERVGIAADQAAYIARVTNGNYVAARRKAVGQEDAEVTESGETKRSDLEDFKAMMRNAYTIGVLQDRQKKYKALADLRDWSRQMATIGREAQKNFLQYAQQQVRENYISNLKQPILNYQSDEEKAFSARFAPYIHSGNVEEIMNELDKAERQITQNAKPEIVLFDMCMQMIVLLKKRPI